MKFLKQDVSTLPFDERGHRHLYQRGDLSASRGGFIDDDGEEHWFDRVDIWTGAFPCHWCDAYPGFRVVADDDNQPVSVIAATACTLPRGTTTVVDLAVPSGRIILGDVLQPHLVLPLRHETDRRARVQLDRRTGPLHRRDGRHRLRLRPGRGR